MAKAIAQSPSGAVALEEPENDADPYFNWVEGKPPIPHGITVFWQKTKRYHLPWASYGGMYQPNLKTFDMYFDNKMVIVRGSITKSKTQYPIEELWKALEHKYLFALYDAPSRGLQIRVFKLVKTEDGISEEAL